MILHSVHLRRNIPGAILSEDVVQNAYVILRMVTLTVCEKDEFTCFDGSCISMDLRCNGREDCIDA